MIDAAWNRLPRLDCRRPILLRAGYRQNREADLIGGGRVTSKAKLPTGAALRVIGTFDGAGCEERSGGDRVEWDPGGHFGLSLSGVRVYRPFP